MSMHSRGTQLTCSRPRSWPIHTTWNNNRRCNRGGVWQNRQMARSWFEEEWWAGYRGACQRGGSSINQILGKSSNSLCCSSLHMHVFIVQMVHKHVKQFIIIYFYVSVYIKFSNIAFFRLQWSNIKIATSPMRGWRLKSGWLLNPETCVYLSGMSICTIFIKEINFLNIILLSFFNSFLMTISPTSITYNLWVETKHVVGVVAKCTETMKIQIECWCKGSGIVNIYCDCKIKGLLDLKFWYLYQDSSNPCY